MNVNDIGQFLQAGGWNVGGGAKSQLFIGTPPPREGSRQIGPQAIFVANWAPADWAPANWAPADWDPGKLGP